MCTRFSAWVLLLHSCLFWLPVSASKSPPRDVTEVLVPEYGDTFIEASIGDASNLLPVLASDSASSAINRLVYSGLLRYDKNLSWKGNWPNAGRCRRITAP
jgi:hypothetical protein